jgi:hypothetical protein
VYGPVRTVVWEDGGREAPSYPIRAVTLASAHFRAIRQTRCDDAMPQLTSFVNVR